MLTANSPEPLSLDIITVTPFPIVINTGATITLEVQITLKEEVAVGASVHLDLKLEGIIPIKIPCTEIDGLQIGSW
jgi:hypothetical protein